MSFEIDIDDCDTESEADGVSNCGVDVLSCLVIFSTIEQFVAVR